MKNNGTISIKVNKTAMEQYLEQMELVRLSLTRKREYEAAIILDDFLELLKCKMKKKSYNGTISKKNIGGPKSTPQRSR